MSKNLMPQWLMTRPEPDGSARVLRYALPALWTERRDSGWYVAQAVPVFSEGMEGGPQWNGPFATIELACAWIAEKFTTVLAAAHKEGVEYHKLNPRSPLFSAEVTPPTS